MPANAESASNMNEESTTVDFDFPNKSFPFLFLHVEPESGSEALRVMNFQQIQKTVTTEQKLRQKKQHAKWASKQQEPTLDDVPVPDVFDGQFMGINELQIPPEKRRNLAVEHPFLSLPYVENDVATQIDEIKGIKYTYFWFLT